MVVLLRAHTGGRRAGPAEAVLGALKALTGDLVAASTVEHIVEQTQIVEAIHLRARLRFACP